MNIDEIRGDLKYGHVGGLENAFRVLIATDQPVEGICDGADEACALLEELANALSTDRATMPDELARALAQSARTSQ